MRSRHLRARAIAVVGIAAAVGTLGATDAIARAARILRVPQDFPTVQSAVDASAPGESVLISAGVYRESVSVPASKPGLTIRGVDRNRVVFDGEDVRDGAITVRADRVTIENLSAHDYLGNAIYWGGVRGYSGLYLTVWNVRRYGIYSEHSSGGLIAYDYVSGAADAAYYIGECNPCATVMEHVVAYRSAVGYSGTNAGGGLQIRDSLWDANGAGILPNSYDSEANPPQSGAFITGNVVRRSGQLPVPRHTPLAGYLGVGIGIDGGRHDTVGDNRVSASVTYGIAVFPASQIWPGHRGPPWRPQDNLIRHNVVHRSGVADLALSAGSGTRNCFTGNTVERTLPASLGATCPARQGSARVAHDLAAPNGVLLARLQRSHPHPPDFRSLPAPPPQANLPAVRRLRAADRRSRR